MVHTPHAIQSVMMVSFRWLFGPWYFVADQVACVIVRSGGIQRAWILARKGSLID